MIELIGKPFVPDWASPPGETILDIAEERGWSQAELARQLGYTEEHAFAGVASETERAEYDEDEAAQMVFVPFSPRSWGCSTRRWAA